jgi:hypothetical protein
MKNSNKRSLLFVVVIALTVCAFMPGIPLNQANTEQQIADGPTPWPPPGLNLQAQTSWLASISSGRRG